MNKLLCNVNGNKNPGVVCGYATHDLSRCVLRWGLCAHQRPDATRHREINVPRETKGTVKHETSGVIRGSS